MGVRGITDSLTSVDLETHPDTVHTKGGETLPHCHFFRNIALSLIAHTKGRGIWISHTGYVELHCLHTHTLDAIYRALLEITL